MNYNKKDAKFLFSKIAKYYDLNNTLLSLGIHHLWKRRLVKLIKSSQPKQVLDLCTGTGDVLALLGNDIEALGVDICPEMLEIARKKTNHPLKEGNVEALDIQDSFADVVSVTFGVRNIDNLTQGLSEIKRVLKKEGYLYILEFGQPQNTLIRFFFGLYSRYILPFLGGFISHDKKAYQYLHQSSWAFPCAEQFVSLLKQHGFKDISFQALSFGIAYLYVIKKI